MNNEIKKDKIIFTRKGQLMFIALLTYKKPIEEIEQSLAEHIRFLDRYYENNKFLISGRRNPRVGGIILVNSDSLEEVKQIISEDPFHINNLADYEIIEFIPTKFISQLSDII